MEKINFLPMTTKKYFEGKLDPILNEKNIIGYIYDYRMVCTRALRGYGPNRRNTGRTREGMKWNPTGIAGPRS